MKSRTNKKNNEGFTLLELIIVVIIVGVLASLALPRLFATVEYSRSAEAFAALGSLRAAMERCSLRSGSGSYAACTMGVLDLANPSTTAGTHFTYAISGQGAGVYTLTATRNTLEGGAAASTIVMAQTAAGATRSGTTAFAGVQ